MFFRSSKGFSLVSVLVAAALLGGLTMAFMQLTKNMKTSQSSAQSKADEIELAASIRLLLDDERHCRLSLAGVGPSGEPVYPVTFKKKNIDEDDEGLDVALFLSDQDGYGRGLKKYNGANYPEGEDKSKYGKLTIASMKLIMNNGTGINYSESTGHNDIGQLRVVVQKKISSGNIRNIVMNFDLNVGMRTNSSGTSTILSCSHQPETEEEEEEEYYYPKVCRIRLSHRDADYGWKNASGPQGQGGFASLGLSGDVNGDDKFRLYFRCHGTGATNEIDDYLKSCNIGLGHRDSTSSPSPLRAYPANYIETTYNDSSKYLQTTGDVNGDDSFYFRVKCPAGSNSELDDYMKRTCRLCLGFVDSGRVTPEHVACGNFQDWNDSKWNRIMPSGDVGGDDRIFAGFFCNGEYFPQVKF